jgi:hypothetical protein
MRPKFTIVVCYKRNSFHQPIRIKYILVYKKAPVTFLYLSILLHAIFNSLCISSPSVMQQIIFSFHFHSTQHVSALCGHLQVFESVETAILHQCALKLHTLQSIYYYKIN